MTRARYGAVALSAARATRNGGPAAPVTAAGAQVDHPLAAGDHRHVVLDRHDRVAGVDQPAQPVHQHLHVGGAQPT
ncbi:hypothetical protein J2Z21_005735 [Streptomyces griseochromogenes]|uniref:Uncharacterized protein n=1 Tax=Streptomyces griseochromogenes TaxID=68214 RepID=A0A1B1B9W2_9ACTN|nr:hypothetical protein AVL59_43935 [Streptomyces griseochromogenes]MBP2052748.1 hypothetical protein [Streptomyces griseochromogenes]